jgi:hypothetical protein
MKKNMLFPGFVLSMLFCANMAFAQATSASAVPVPAPISSVATVPTFAGVADKTVSETFSLIKDGASVLGDTVKKVAPEVWRVLILQQYVKAAQGIFIPLMVLILAGLYYKIINKVWKKPEYDDDFGHQVCCKVLPIGVLIITFVVFIIGISNAIQYIINPEYSAILDLLDMVKTIK